MPETEKASMAPSIPIFQEFKSQNETVSQWIDRLENHLELQGVKEEDRKKRALLAFVGADGYRRLHDRLKPQKDIKEVDYKEVVKVLKLIFEPKKNKFSERSQFRKVKQNPGESFADYENRLRHAAIDCSFGAAQLEERLIEQFIEGLSDRMVVQNLLMRTESDANFKTLEDVASLAATVMMVQKATTNLTGIAASTENSAVLKVNSYPRRQFQKHAAPFNPGRSNRHPQRNGPPRRTSPPTRNGPSSFRGVAKCYRCGDPSHMANTCRHISSTCDACGHVGHLKSVCRKSQAGHNYLEEHQLHQIGSKTPIYTTVSIAGHNVSMEIDTGTEISTMKFDDFRRILPHHELKRNDIQLRSATGEKFQPHSYADVIVSYGNCRAMLRLYLIENALFPTLIGRAWLRALPIDINSLLMPKTSTSCNQIRHSEYKTAAANLLKKFPNLTKPGIGRIPNAEAKLELSTDAPQITYARARPIAHSMLELTNRELAFLEEQRIIEKIPVSDWAHPIVVVPRAQGRKVRICGDFKTGVNRYIRIDEHPLKNIRHALDNIGNGQSFSKLDISNAFLHMPLRESDQKLVVVNTHRGLYKFLRMSNGLSNAPAIWQRFIEGILGGIPGVECVIDDIIITGATDDEHLRRLEKVLRVLNEHDIRLNQEKCAFFENSVKFCGFNLKSGEIRKCTDKVHAIRKASIPRNISELRAFLGLIQFYAPFASRLADLASPLYELLKGDVPFVWSAEADTSFNRVKDELCSERVLVPFDPKKPLVLATDASPVGISAVLFHCYGEQGERPIAFYSRTLTTTERKYCQLDKEALAIKTGVEKFFHYLFGRRFRLVTDSRPLVQIFSPEKNLPPLSAIRMQHYAIYLMGFNFTIHYRPSKENSNADALSRLPASSNELPGVDSTETFIVNQLQNAPLRMEEIAEKTKTCPELSPLLSTLKGSASQSKLTFFGVDICEFSLHEDSIILRGHRVMIPKVFRPMVLAELHEGHYGSRKMKELARRYVWWKTIDQDINDVTLRCLPCLTHARNPPKSTHQWEPATRAFERIHMDYAGPFQGKYFLLLVDAYSKWLEVFVTSNKTSETTLQHLEECIARFGIPSILVTDNDPTFVSGLVDDFCKRFGFIHKTSPPFHPASNGQVEKYVQTLKNALRKLREEGGALHQNLSRFLFRQRMMVGPTGNTPASRMLGREIRSKLDLLKEPERKTTFASGQHQNPTRFVIGETVMARDYRSPTCRWRPGRIIQVRGSKVRDVMVDGMRWKRHVDRLRRCKLDCSPGETETTGSAVLLWPPIKNTNEQTQSDFAEVETTDSAADIVEVETPPQASPSSDEEFYDVDDAQEFEEADANDAPPTSSRRSSRPNKGKPPIRYRDSM